MSNLGRRPPVPQPTTLDSVASSANTFGVKILKPEFYGKAQVYGPSWKATETIIRPYPSLSYDDANKFEPYRIKRQGEYEFGNWIRRYDVCWKVGKGQNKRTFIVHNPANGSYDLNSTPLQVMCREISNAKKNPSVIRQHPTFPMLMDWDSATGGTALSWTKSVFLIQGTLLVHGSKLKYGVNDRNEMRAPLGTGEEPSCIFTIPGGSPKASNTNAAGKVLLNMLNEQNTEYSDPEDFETRFRYGDPVAPESGRFFVFKEAGSFVAQSMLQRPNAGVNRGGGFRNAMAQAANGGGAASNFKGYDVEITNLPLVDGTSPVMSDEAAIADIKSHWLYWEDVLWFPTLVEQARELNEVFDPDEIVYAFRGCDPDWITDETHRKYRGTVSVKAETPAAITDSRPAYYQDEPFGYPAGSHENIDEPISRPASASKLDAIRGDKPVMFNASKVRSSDVVVPTAPARQPVAPAHSEVDDTDDGYQAMDDSVSSIVRLRNQGKV